MTSNAAVVSPTALTPIMDDLSGTKDSSPIAYREEPYAKELVFAMRFADALPIETRAQCCLADEYYDAAQEGHPVFSGQCPHPAEANMRMAEG
jgi:hypothetical protein